MSLQIAIEKLAEKHSKKLTPKGREGDLSFWETNDEEPLRLAFDNRGQLWVLEFKKYNFRRFNSSELTDVDIETALESLFGNKYKTGTTKLLRRPYIELPLKQGSYRARAST